MIGQTFTIEFFMGSRKVWALGALEHSSKPNQYIVVIPTGSLSGVSFNLSFVQDIDTVSRLIKLRK